MSARRDIDDLVRWLREHGYRIEKTGKGHYKVFAPNRVVIMPSSPSDWRSVKNTVSDLRRAGVVGL